MTNREFKRQLQEDLGVKAVIVMGPCDAFVSRKGTLEQCRATGVYQEAIDMILCPDCLPSLMQCEGQNFSDSGAQSWQCSKQGTARPHLDNQIFCDRHNEELS